MTDLDTNTKRLANEFMWILCDENQKLFQNLCGLGSTIWFLQVKGIFK